VASLAGLPKLVISRASEILKGLKKDPMPQVLQAIPPTQLELPTVSLVEKTLKQMDPDQLSPKEALDFLYKLRSMICENE
jgi:DNA mismatch repair protein MutS